MLEIRPAALSEFALLPQIEAEADLLFASLQPPYSLAEFPPPGSADSYANALHIMVAGRPPGAFVRLDDLEGELHLEQLSVAPEFQGQGIGRALIRAAKAWGAESGYSRITLCTFAEVPFNAPFYATCGFRGLTDSELTPSLAALRRHERELGLDDVGPRVVMEAKI